MRVTKYNYYKVIQQNYGVGWEDVDYHKCNSTGGNLKKSNICKTTKSGRQYFLTELAENLRSYRENSPYPTRVVLKKILKELDK